jgi:sodium transport system permease protein
MTRYALVVAKKELLDHVRDGRSLMTTVLYSLLGPLVVALVSLSGRAGSNPAVLLGMMSVFALVATFVGGTNIAMDGIAGERERRSLTPLLLVPIPRADLVVGKWIATSFFAFAGLAVNLIGCVVALALAPGPLPVERFPLLAVWATFGLVPLALMASAIELLISSLCRTMKEAHMYLSMVVFLPMMVGMFLTFSPNRPGGWSLVIPLVGQQSLLERGLSGERLAFSSCLFLALMTLAAAVPAIAGTAAVLGRDQSTAAG